MGAKAVLLVEDNADDVELTLRSLRDAGIANPVDVARDGPEALEYLFGKGRHAGRDASVSPAVVLLDVQLPKLSGIEVLERIRADPRTTLLPVVMLTSSREQRDRLAAYRGRANSFVQKPVDFAHFSEAVRQLGLYWLVLNAPPPRGGTAR